MAVTTHGASSTRKELPRVEMTLKGHEDQVGGVAFIPGTRLLVTCSDDNSLRVWDLDTGKQVGEPLLGHDDKVWTVAASSDGCWIVSGGYNGSILVWEVETNKRVPVSFKGHNSAILGVVFAPDNETFASASSGTVCVWNRKTGKIVLGPLRVGSRAYSVAYSPDGSKLASGTGKHIIVWNSATGEELLKIEQPAWQVAFTPDGLRLVSANYKDIRISDAATGDIIKQFDVHVENFISLAIAPNGTKFATTSDHKMTRFFDLTTFEPIGEPLEHPDVVYCVAFSEDSQLIATGCNDKLIRTWTVPQSESEQSEQRILKKTIPGQKLRPQRTRIPPRFFNDFDTHSPPGRNNGTTTTTRHAEGSRMKNMMHRLFSRSSASQGDTPLPSRIPAVDVFATRGKYRTANAISGKRHVVQRPRPPPQPAHTSNAGEANAGASSSSAPPVGISNVTDGTTSATLQTGSTSASAAMNRPPSPLDVEYVPDISCCALLARFFPCVSRTQPVSTAASRTH